MQHSIDLLICEEYYMATAIYDDSTTNERIRHVFPTARPVVVAVAARPRYHGTTKQA